MTNPFQTRIPNIGGNALIREPQQGAYQEMTNFASNPDAGQEAGIILPVGCGKSGCITLAPFAFRAKKTLVVAPGLNISSQLYEDFNPSFPGMFYQKCRVLADGPYPEPVEIRGNTTNRGDLNEADVVVTNIQQLQREDNKWLDQLPSDYFDLILFDEGHHSVAATYNALKQHFNTARIVNFSATPLRADGQLMAGKVIYTFPIFRAIQAGYVKRLKAVQLNPRSLRYVRQKDGQEIDVTLDEVRKLGEEDADFRRSIVTSSETLNTIVDASLRELDRLRAESGDQNLKIIASALNLDHCRQIVEAYVSRNRRAAYVHSLVGGQANKRVMDRLENNELDVIVQVRKLGEGFDHPRLAVAAIFSIFANLSPFVQFVGRIMRVIRQNAPNDVVNRGVVVFHAGANIARQWGDFQAYSEADKEFFDQLLPLEGFDPSDLTAERVIDPAPRYNEEVEVRAQSEVQLEEIHLIKDDEAAAIQLLQQRGYIPAEFDPTSQLLQPIPTTKVARRQAARGGLDMRVMTAARKVLGEKGVDPNGSELDKAHLGKNNLIIMKAALDKKVNALAGIKSKQRSELRQSQLDEIDEKFSDLVLLATKEIFGGD